MWLQYNRDSGNIDVFGVDIFVIFFNRGKSLARRDVGTPKRLYDHTIQNLVWYSLTATAWRTQTYRVIFYVWFYGVFWEADVSAILTVSHKRIVRKTLPRAFGRYDDTLCSSDETLSERRDVVRVVCQLFRHYFTRLPGQVRRPGGHGKRTIGRPGVVRVTSRETLFKSNRRRIRRRALAAESSRLFIPSYAHA